MPGREVAAEITLPIPKRQGDAHAARFARQLPVERGGDQAGRNRARHRSAEGLARTRRRCALRPCIGERVDGRGQGRGRGRGLVVPCDRIEGVGGMRPQPAMAIRRRGQHLVRRHRSGDLRLGTCRPRTRRLFSMPSGTSGVIVAAP